MNISSNNTNALAKMLAATLVLTVIGGLLLASRQSNVVLQERVFENKIPDRIPIKIKIKKEKTESFKDLKNEKWFKRL